MVEARGKAEGVDHERAQAMLGRVEWSREEDSNPRPTVYKTVALPTELSRQMV
jgi:hypothetical protein